MGVYRGLNVYVIGVCLIRGSHVQLVRIGIHRGQYSHYRGHGHMIWLYIYLGYLEEVLPINEELLCNSSLLSYWSCAPCSYLVYIVFMLIISFLCVCMPSLALGHGHT
jgi:hypothetical protein